LPENGHVHKFINQYTKKCGKFVKVAKIVSVRVTTKL